MSTARKILGNTFIQFGGKIVTAILSVFVLKMISGYLGVAGYGEYTSVYEFLALFGIAADFGIFTITVKEMSKDEKQIPYILGNVLGLRTVLTIITMALAAIAVFLIPQYSGSLIPMGVLIGTFATFFALLNGTVSTVLQVNLKMQYATISLVIGKLISIGYIALVVYYLFQDDLSTGFAHLIGAGVLGNLAMFAITSYFVSRFYKIRYRFDYPFWKRIFLTSLPYGVALMLNTVYYRIDILLMRLILPAANEVMVNGSLDYACQQDICANTEVGIYGVGMRFLDMLIIIPVYFMNSVLPTMTRFLEEQKEKINRIVQLSFDFLIATAMPILVGGFILATPIILLISEKDFVTGELFEYGSDLAVKILMFAMFFSFLNALFGFTLVVLKKQKKLMWINAACVVFNLISNLIVIPQWGFRGAAVTSVLCELFILIFTFIAVKKVLSFKLNFQTAFKVLLSSVTMGVAVGLGVFWMKDLWFVWQIVFLIPLGGVIYLATMMSTGAITPEMRSLLKRK